MDPTRAALMELLAAGPGRVRTNALAAEAATGRAADAGGGASARGEVRWTARQNVAHMVLVERLVFHARLDQLMAGDAPRWGWTEPPTSDEPDVATLELALATFAVARSDTLARVAALDQGGWARFGHHATYGRLDVAGLLGVILDHDAHHLADIAALAGASGSR